MKSFKTNLMVAAGALIVVAGSASAQVMSAQIPFEFNANGAHLAPGTYRVSVRSLGMGAPVIQLFNRDSRAGAMSLGTPGKDAPKSWLSRGGAVLSFACAAGRCDLRSIWPGDGARTFDVPAPKTARSDFAGVEIINIPVTKAD